MRLSKIFKLFFLLMFFAASPAFAGLTFTQLHYENAGSEVLVYGRVSFDSSYPTNGEPLVNNILGLSKVDQILIPTSNGLVFSFDITNKKIKVFQSGAATPAGTITAPVFTGTSPISDLNLATPAFSGTGLTAAGQVMTTTDNQTMTLNQCAGMWLIPATQATPPMLILSNTAVTGAPAVLTVQGAAATDAGAYKIVKALTPVGTNSAPTFTGSAIAAAALSEVSNATNLSSVTNVPFIALGKY